MVSVDTSIVSRDTLGMSAAIASRATTSPSPDSRAEMVLQVGCTRKGGLSAWVTPSGRGSISDIVDVVYRLDDGPAIKERWHNITGTAARIPAKGFIQALLGHGRLMIETERADGRIAATFPLDSVAHRLREMRGPCWELQGVPLDRY